MLKVIYSKFSNDRNPAYAIRTNILKDEAGQKYVQKLPMSEQSKLHVEKMCANEEKLAEAYKNTVLKPNKTLVVEGQTLFEFVQGESLTEKLDGCLLANDLEGFYQLFEQYETVMKAVSEKACNIDLIPDNIIVSDDAWTVIDYEWVLEEPVSTRFILYRAIHYFVGDLEQSRNGLRADDLYAHFGIAASEIEAFQKEEADFQQKLDGDYTKLSTMKFEHNMLTRDINQAMQLLEWEREEREVCIRFIHNDDSETEENRKLVLNEQKEIAFAFEVDEDVKKLIFLFPYEQCYVHVKSIVEKAEENIPVDFTTDGTAYEGNVVKLQKGQGILVSNEEKAHSNISVHFTCYLADEVMREVLKEEADNQQKMVALLGKSIAERDAKLEMNEQMLRTMQFRQEQIRQMQETPIVHYFGRLLNKMRGYDPISALRPLLSQEQSGLQFCVDEVGYHTYSLFIRGWVFHKQGIPVSLLVRDEKGKFLKTEIVKNPREDVAEAFGIATEDVYGFTVFVAKKELCTEKVYLEMETIGGYISQEVIAYGGKAFEAEWKKREESVFEYDEWAKHYMPTEKELKRQRRTRFKYRPLISVIVPLYNTPLDYLETLIRSVLDQTYSNMQLCLADGSSNDIVQEYVASHYGNDARVKYKRLTENRGISGNTIDALELADGEFIMLSDHDDEVMLNACYEMVKALNSDPEIDAVYTDEDKMTMAGDYYFDPHFKPDFNLEFLRSNNYICHIFLIRKSIVDSLDETFRTKYDGAQDFDFILRCCEKARKVYHVPKIVYHWRSHPLSTAGNPESKDYAYEAGRASVEASYERLGIPATVTRTPYFGRYRTQFHIDGTPLVSVVIDASACEDIKQLEKCVASIRDVNTYHNVEILLAGTKFDTKELSSMQAFADCKILEKIDKTDSYRAYEAGIAAAEGDYVVLMKSSVYASEENWMQEMLSYCQREDIGICGGMIVKEDDTVYSAGMVVGMQGIIGHLFQGVNKDLFSFAGWLNSTRDVSAMSDLCFMVKKADFLSVGGFDAKMENLGVADLCLRMTKQGHRAIYDTYVELTYTGKEDVAYGETATAFFKKQWNDYFINGDPYYNANLTLEHGLCKLREI